MSKITEIVELIISNDELKVVYNDGDHYIALAQLLGVGKVTSAYGKGVNNLTKMLSTIAGFKVDDLILIWQAIQNPIQEKLLSEVKHEKVNHW
jgi:hypothetical protein